MTLRPISLYDLEAHAETALPPAVWDFIASGAQDELTLDRNRRAFDDIVLRPRFMVDVSERDLRTTVLGEEISFPVMLAPTGSQAQAHADGEMAAVRAAGAAGTLMALSTPSNYALEQVAEAANGPLWFQLYHRGKDLTSMLVKRAEKAGYKAVAITVDTPLPGPKERDMRNRYRRPAGLELANFTGEAAGLGVEPGSAAAARWEMPESTPFLWEDIKWLRGETSMKIVIKGLITAEDAHLAAEHGVDGIVVSNHGARHMDSTLSSIEALPEMVEAVDGRTEIFLDSGIRRGSDVLKALALGARGVFIGRAISWGLAWNGEEGVRLALEILRTEFDRVLGYCGCTGVQDVHRSLVKLPKSWEN